MLLIVTVLYPKIIIEMLTALLKNVLLINARLLLKLLKTFSMTKTLEKTFYRLRPLHTMLQGGCRSKYIKTYIPHKNIKSPRPTNI